MAAFLRTLSKSTANKLGSLEERSKNVEFLKLIDAEIVRTVFEIRSEGCARNINNIKNPDDGVHKLPTHIPSLPFFGWCGVGWRREWVDVFLKPREHHES